MNSFISGSYETPTEAATISPMDLVIAKPGTLSFLVQTLKGPIALPNWSLKDSTLPP